MSKALPFLVIACFVSLFLIPPIDFVIKNPQNEYWLWMILISGFLGFLTLFLPISKVVKAIAISGFINCFFSCAPYISFTSYVSLILCLYFYILCTAIKDWSWIIKALKAILCLNLFL